MITLNKHINLGGYTDRKRIVDRLTTLLEQPDRAAQITDGYTEFGEAFIAFITCAPILDETAAADRLVEACSGAYIKTWETSDEALEMLAQTLVKQETIACLTADSDEGPVSELLLWDADAVLERLDGKYLFVELPGGRICAFDRRVIDKYMKP